jgi:hypothetical protein
MPHPHSLPLAALVSLALTGCAATAPIPTTPYTEPAAVADQATVYVYRAQSVPASGHVTVQVDGRPVAVLPDNRVTWFRVAPGRHVLRAGTPYFPDPSATLELNLAAGATYVLRYHRDAGDGDLPVYGRGGWLAGVVRTDEAGWHDLQLVPGATPAQVTSKLEYVEARP